MLKTFQEAEGYLQSFIPKTTSFTYSADWGLERTKSLLKLLGNPQDQIKVIHVAGTSGKGSTSTLMSLILKDLGLKVGLCLSPHLIDIRERFQVNNDLISEEKFISFVNDLVPFIKKVEASPQGKPTYFELVTILAFYIFWKEKVDFAVMETGMGGLYDATNTVQRLDKTAVLTKIGLDHTAILGNSIDKIASQKAGIIHPGNKVFSIKQEKEAEKVIDKIALEKGVAVTYIGPEALKYIRVSSKNTIFDFCFQEINFKKLELNLLGKFQAENCSLALSTIYYLSKKYGFEFNEQKIRQALSKASFPGRMEIIHKNSKFIVVDGAHNPQKMESFLSSLKEIFPRKKFNFLIAFKKDKDYPEILRLITPLAKKVFVTTFFIESMDMLSFSEDPNDIAKTLKELNFQNYKVIKDSKKALEKALGEDDDLVITGSLYLLSDLYSNV